MSTNRVALVLINTGTPAAPTVWAVRRYLREFLLDPRVVDLVGWKRRLLVDLLIVPRRSRRSAAAYRQIWARGGKAPLLAHAEALAWEVQRRIAPVGIGDAPDPTRPIVAVAMRYGRPAIDEVLGELRRRGVDRIVAFPLFPQYAAASAGSAIAALYRRAAECWNTPFVQVVPPFFDHPAFIEALAVRALPVLQQGPFERVIFSYHGLPERHVRRGADSPAHCLQQPDCCDTLSRTNRSCYRAQCHATTRALARRLGLTAEQVTVCFQSRIGSDRWLGPATESVLEALPGAGVRRAVLLGPSFVADCLETLYELQLLAQRRFGRAGGEQLRVVPGLNATPAWADAVVAIAREATRWLDCRAR